MNELLKLLREGLDVDISDAELLGVYEEVSGCTSGGTLAGGDGGRSEPLMAADKKKAIEKTKRIVMRRGKLVEHNASMTRVKNRVRNGGRTVQRRKRVSSRKGWTYDSRKKRVSRIDALERMRRSRGSKLSASKRASKRTIAKVKRARSMRMRKALGWNRPRRRR